MTTEQYKQICQGPNVLSRSVIEETLRLLPQKRLELDSVLRGNPIEKPPFHHGTTQTDHFSVRLSAREIHEISEQLLALEAEASADQVTFIADLVDIWTNLADFN